jgi:hypothetical protein
LPIRSSGALGSVYSRYNEKELLNSAKVSLTLRNAAVASWVAVPIASLIFIWLLTPRLAAQTTVPSSSAETGPKCDTVLEVETHIKCTYSAAPLSDPGTKTGSRIVLNGARMSFGSTKKGEQGDFDLELTFTNEGTDQVSPGLKVYFEVDGDTGRNYIRRPLPDLVLSDLAPGERRTFSEEIDVGYFRIGHYTINLWMPDPDPALKFNSAHNFLLSSVGVPDPTTRLNKLADFTIRTPPPPRR